MEVAAVPAVPGRRGLGVASICVSARPNKNTGPTTTVQIHQPPGPGGRGWGTWLLATKPAALEAPGVRAKAALGSGQAPVPLLRQLGGRLKLLRDTFTTCNQSVTAPLWAEPQEAAGAPGCSAPPPPPGTSAALERLGPVSSSVRTLLRPLPHPRGQGEVRTPRCAPATAPASRSGSCDPLPTEVMHPREPETELDVSSFCSFPDVNSNPSVLQLLAPKTEGNLLHVS